MSTTYFKLGVSEKTTMSNSWLLKLYAVFVAFKISDFFVRKVNNSKQLIAEIIIYTLVGTLVILKNMELWIFKNKRFVELTDDSLRFRERNYKSITEIKWDHLERVVYNDYKYNFILKDNTRKNLNLSWEPIKNANHINQAIKTRLSNSSINLSKE